VLCWLNGARHSLGRSSGFRNRANSPRSARVVFFLIVTKSGKLDIPDLAPNRGVYRRLNSRTCCVRPTRSPMPRHQPLGIHIIHAPLQTAIGVIHFRRLWVCRLWVCRLSPPGGLWCANRTRPPGHAAGPSIFSSAARGTSNRLPIRIVGICPSCAAAYALLRPSPSIAPASSTVQVCRFGLFRRLLFLIVFL
jgi:hypothetical protein